MRQLNFTQGMSFPANFALVYGPAFRVRGNGSGIPTSEPGLSVMLRSKDGGWPMSSSETEVKKDGSFEIRKVLPGSYEVCLMTTTGDTRQTMQAAQRDRSKRG